MKAAGSRDAQDVLPAVPGVEVVGVQTKQANLLPGKGEYGKSSISKGCRGRLLRSGQIIYYTVWTRF